MADAYIEAGVVGLTLAARTPECDATVHNLSFGPSCGEATLDGEPVDLDALQAEGHGRRGRHRPF